MRSPHLLTIDAAINLALGLLLVLFPRPAAEVLGVPVPTPTFYASILGAVLTGIGLALLIERFRARYGVAGLGLGGAICINVCGAGVLALWLIAGELTMPLRGRVFLWALAIAILGLSIVEAAAQWRRGSQRTVQDGPGSG